MREATKPFAPASCRKFQTRGKRGRGLLKVDLERQAEAIDRVAENEDGKRRRRSFQRVTDDLRKCP